MDRSRGQSLLANFASGQAASSGMSASSIRMRNDAANGASPSMSTPRRDTSFTPGGSGF